jgi:WD40 repeat protein
MILRLAELEAGESRLVGQAAAPIWRIGYVPDGERLVTSSEGNVYQMWSLGDGRGSPMQTFEGPGATMRGWRLDPAGRLIGAANGARKTASILNLDAPPGTEYLRLRRGGEVDATFGFAIHPDGTWVAVADTNTVSIWPLGRRYSQILGRQEAAFSGVVHDPDGEWIATSSWDGTIRLWPLEWEGGREPRILYSLEGRLVNELAVSPGGEWLAAYPWGEGLVVVPVSGGTPKVLAGFAVSAWRPVFDRDGRRVAAGGGGQLRDDAVIRIWDLESGAAQVLDAGDGKAVYAVEFTVDGHLLSSGEGGLRSWDPEAGTYEQLFDGVLGPCGSLSPDGRFFMAAGFEGRTGGVARIFDLQGGTSADLNSHGDQVVACAWHPSGEVVATSDQTGVIRIGPMTGEEPHLLLGHSGGVFSVSFDPTGEWLVSAGGEGTLRRWPIPGGAPLHTLPREELLAKLSSLTNYRVVPEEGSASGYRVEFDVLPSWETAPTW